MKRNSSVTPCYLLLAIAFFALAVALPMDELVVAAGQGEKENASTSERYNLRPRQKSKTIILGNILNLCGKFELFSF